MESGNFFSERYQNIFIDDPEFDVFSIEVENDIDGIISTHTPESDHGIADPEKKNAYLKFWAAPPV